MCACVHVCVWLQAEGVHVRQMFSTHSRAAGHAVINQGGRGHCGELLLLLLQLRPSRQNNNTEELILQEPEVRPCTTALTEAEGKTVILRSPSTLHPPASLHGGGIILPGPPPSYDESPALRRLASPTSICRRLDPLITMPATSHH